MHIALWKNHYPKFVGISTFTQYFKQDCDQLIHSLNRFIVEHYLVVFLNTNMLF